MVRNRIKVTNVPIRTELRREPSHECKNKGFTLIELLVVVAIIALLIGLLLPTLAKARQSAHLLTDLSNLRQIAGASATYESEHEHYPILYSVAEQAIGTGSPRFGLAGYKFGGKSPMKDDSPNPLSPLYIPHYSRPLNEYLYDINSQRSFDLQMVGEDEDRVEFEIFRSPADSVGKVEQEFLIHQENRDLFYDGRVANRARSIYEAVGTSYFQNNWVFESPGDFGIVSRPYHKQIPERGSRILKDVRNRQNPSRFVLFTEFPVYMTLRASTREANLVIPGWYEPRKNSTTTSEDISSSFSNAAMSSDYVSAFADGHAKKITMTNRHFVPLAPGQSAHNSDGTQRPATGQDYTFANTRHMLQFSSK